MTTLRTGARSSTRGIPDLDRDLGRAVSPWIELGKQVGLVSLAVFLYFAVRGMTQGDVPTAIANGLDVLRFERAIGIDVEHWAQRQILDHHTLVTLANGTPSPSSRTRIECSSLHRWSTSTQRYRACTSAGTC